jgi:PAS domain S-box-containing protein
MSGIKFKFVTSGIAIITPLMLSMPLEDLFSPLFVNSFFAGLCLLTLIIIRKSEQKKLRVERELRQSLQQSEKKHRMLIESSRDGIVFSTCDGLIELVNESLCQMLGYKEEELLGRSIFEFIDPTYHEVIYRQLQKHEGNESANYELELLCRNQEYISVLVLVSPVFNEEKHVGNLGIVTNITGKKRAEQEIKRQNEELFAVNAIAETANQSLILEEIFEAAVHKIREVLKLDGCLISFLNENSSEMSVSASAGFSEDFLNDPSIRSTQLGVGYAGLAAESAQLIIIEDVSMAEYPMALQLEGIISAAFIPIKARQACYGIIGCASRTPRAFSEQDIRLLTTIGQTMGIAVEKARLYENERRRVTRLETIYKVSDKLTGLMELSELLPVLVKLIFDTFNYYNVNLFLVDKQSGDLIFTAGCGGFRLPAPLGVRIKPPAGIVGTCFTKRETVLVNDVNKESSYLYIEGLPETRSEMAIPIRWRDTVIGVLDVQSSSFDAFDKEDVLTLQVLAEQIGVALENARLYDRLRHSLEEVRQSQAFFAKIVLESPIPTFITDSHSTCILINQSALSLLGNNVEYDKVIGSYNLLTDLPFAASPIAGEIRTALEGQVVQLTVDLPSPKAGLDHTQREMLTLRATIFPLMDEFGKVANLVAMFEDLTEKKRLEEALQQAQKMESIGTLAGGIAHDFNNILGGVLGYTSFIKTKMSNTDRFYRYIDIIETSARRAADLTHQLLAFARGGKYNSQQLDLNLVVKEAIKLIASTLDKNIRISLNLAPSVPAVEGDIGQIIQTIVNICINARDAMDSGGKLTISSSIEEATDQFLHTHPGAKSSYYVLLAFTDTGTGMTEEVSQRIFEPFFTTKKDQKGTGLGLAMAYGIVKNHGGFIDVESEPGVGTTFSIYLPISGKQTPRTVKKVSVKPKRGNETILVADDEEMMRQLIIEALGSDGYRVIPAENGNEALEIYQTRAQEIDLVILDMIMPGLSGPDAFRRIKEINPSVKVLLSSGYSQEGQAQQILKEGVLGFIQKPYAINDLLNKIRLIIDRI